jgi:hypothetical protein
MVSEYRPHIDRKQFPKYQKLHRIRGDHVIQTGDVVGSILTAPAPQNLKHFKWLELQAEKRVVTARERTVCHYLIWPVEQFGVNSIALDRPVEVISTAALVPLGVEYLELADQIAEDDGAVSVRIKWLSTQSREGCPEQG